MTCFQDNNAHTIQCAKRLYVQWSHDIDFDFSNGNHPSGNEEDFDWEERYIPINHYINGIEVGPTVWRREKVGINGVWTIPVRASGFNKTTSEGNSIVAIWVDEDGYMRLTLDDGTTLIAGATSDDANTIGQVITDMQFDSGTYILTLEGTDRNIIVDISHTHSLEDLTGIVPIVNGGTGANNATSARTNLDVYSTTECDDNFLDEASNLSDVADRQTALDNLTDASSATIGQILSIDESGNSVFETKTYWTRITNFLDTPVSSYNIPTTIDFGNIIDKFTLVKYKQVRDTVQRSTAYSKNDIVITSSGTFQLVCAVAGTTSSIEPTWIYDMGNVVSDGTVKWVYYPRYDYAASIGASSTNILISGMPLRIGGAYLEEVYISPCSNAIWLDITLTSGAFGSATVTDVLDTMEESRQNQPSMFVYMSAYCKTGDTGTNSYINLVNETYVDKLGGVPPEYTLSTNSNKGLEFVTGAIRQTDARDIYPLCMYNDFGIPYGAGSEIVLETDNAGNGDTVGAVITMLCVPHNMLNT